MRKCRWLKSIAALISCLFFPGICAGSGIDNVTGITANAGLTNGNQRTGEFLDLNLNFFFFSVALEAKKLGQEEINSAFVGIGFSPIIQAQVGDGNQGTVYRFKSEFSPASLLENGFVFPLKSAGWEKKITISFAYEKVSGNEGLNNYSVGIGYVFSQP